MPYVSWVATHDYADDVLGDDLISNGHFTSATTGWSAGASGTLAVTADGYLRVTNGAATTGYAYQSVATDVGTLYRIDFAGRLGTATSYRIYASTTNSTTGQLAFSNNVTDAQSSLYFVATATTTYVLLLNNDATAGRYTDFDNIKVRAVQVRGHSTSIEHVVNPGFNVDAQWTKGTGWTIGSGVASSDGTQTTISNLSQQSAGPGVRFGKVYDTSITVSGYSAGNVKFLLGGNGSGTSRASNATFTEQITATTTSGTTHFPGIFVQANADFVGSVDNVSVKLASGNEWALDFDIAEVGYGNEPSVQATRMLSGATETLFWNNKLTRTFTTDALAYGTWQFFEEFCRNAIDGQTISFDQRGTESQPINPEAFIVTGFSINRIVGSGTNERRSYSVQMREA